MAKAKVEKLSLKNVAISTAITVLIAEIVPISLMLTLIWWQTKSLGNPSDWASFFSKGTYGFQDMLNAQNFAFGAGVIVAVAAFIFIVSLIIDEWFYSHRLNSIKNVLIMAATWSISFLLVDTLLVKLNVASSQSIYYGTQFQITFVIFVTAFLIFFARKFAIKK
ncbi:MAG: hypothetical protein Q7S53_00120 [bacterium]|nr:hypothetical protein [bacterium]